MSPVLLRAILMNLLIVDGIMVVLAIHTFKFDHPGVYLYGGSSAVYTDNPKLPLPPYLTSVTKHCTTGKSTCLGSSLIRYAF